MKKYVMPEYRLVQLIEDEAGGIFIACFSRYKSPVNKFFSGFENLPLGKAKELLLDAATYGVASWENASESWGENAVTAYTRVGGEVIAELDDLRYHEWRACAGPAGLHALGYEGKEDNTAC